MAIVALLALSVMAGQKTTPIQITAPPDSLSYNGFYKKHALFRGLSVLGSEKVEDRALATLVETFEKMLAKTPPDLMESLVKLGCHYSIIAEEEGQTDLPEYANLRNDPKTDWNKRARGLGGKYTSGGEENILELPSDRYRGESIFIHEFAHTLDAYGFSRIDPKFRTDLQDAFDTAIAKGLWKNTYAATNRAEYWAEGVQSYFDCNRSATPSNGIHNEICNREQLEKYDEKLFKLIDRSFGKNPWRYEGKYRTTKPVGSPGVGKTNQN